MAVKKDKRKNKAGYTATKVARGWAGAVMNKTNVSNCTGAVEQTMPKNKLTPRREGRPTKPVIELRD